MGLEPRLPLLARVRHREGFAVGGVHGGTEEYPG